jgi:hypothetical protein
MNRLERLRAMLARPPEDPWQRTTQLLWVLGMLPGTRVRAKGDAVRPMTCTLVCVHVEPETLPRHLHAHPACGVLWKWRECFDVSVVMDPRSGTVVGCMDASLGRLVST